MTARSGQCLKKNGFIDSNAARYDHLSRAEVA